MKVLKIALWSALWAGPLTIVGLALCLTVIGIPLGVLLITAGCKPIADLVYNDIRKEAIKNKNLFLNGNDTALDEGIDHPWLD